LDNSLAKPIKAVSDPPNEVFNRIESGLNGMLWQ